MLFNDSPGYPMVFEVHVDFEGTLDRQAFEQALKNAYLTEPLFCCRVVGQPFRSAVWNSCEGWIPKVEWLARIEDAQITPTDNRLADAPSFRLWAANHGETAHVILQFHHAVVDGLGATQFIGELIHAYHKLMGGVPVEQIPPHNSETLQIRNSPSQKEALPLTTTQRIRSQVAEAIRVLRQRPTPLASASSRQHPESRLKYGELLTVEIPSDELLDYRRVATTLDVNLNDLLTTHLFLVMAKWQQQSQCTPNARTCFRITMPVSHHLRLPLALPLCNRIGFAFLTRKFDDTQNPTDLVQNIAHETRLIRNYNLADQFATTLDKVARLPFVLRSLVSPAKCFSTAIFSNMGQVTRQIRVNLPLEDRFVKAGNVRLTRIIAASPLQSNTRLAVCAIIYAGSLFLTFRFDPNHFTRVDAEAFIALMQDSLRQGLGGPIRIVD